MIIEHPAACSWDCMLIDVFLFLVIADVEDTMASLVLIILIMQLLTFMMVICSGVVFVLALKVVVKLIYIVKSVILIMTNIPVQDG